MTALPDDSWLLSIRPQPALVTAEEYDALPEEIARAIRSSTATSSTARLPRLIT
ncbi:hypothetical protein ACQPZZ_31245 [Microbispora sp. CA-135349]|uniref:hypothetical protein n=1 Tax=Microbispora sp. CA-135349 TaxID=3239953 RepID=UPI003D914B63